MADQRFVWMALAFVAAAGCAPPPPEAPEGLEDTTRFLMREFYADDATVGAGLTGLMEWYDDEGQALDGQAPEAEEESASDFRLSPLSAAELANVPAQDEPRDLNDALGVMALSTISCDWVTAGALSIRSDQTAVFDGEWAVYDRSYATERAGFEAASEARDFPAIDAALEPLTEGYDASENAGAILVTENAVGTEEFGAALNYGLNLSFRQGVFEIGGVERQASLVQTWQPSPTTGEGGTNSLNQTWGIDALVELEDGQTLRMVAAWLEIGSIMEADSPILVRLQVNRMNRFSERMTAICDDPSILPAE